MTRSLDDFTRDLVASGLIHNDELQSWLVTIPETSRPQNGEQLARELVKQKRLTKFQAEQIYAGKEKSLTLGNYVILDKLGQGGMGMVLKAKHTRMGRIVALKVMSPAAVKSADAVKRFHREVQTAAKLTHSNIVTAYDADEAKGTHFLVMEYVEGDDLSALVKKHGPMSVEQVIECILQAARGLAHAHAEGVVHRDIKPANLLLDKNGTVKILDMGLARLESGLSDAADVSSAGLTQSGTIMGTVDYMSPEQAEDTRHADARADIYSLGCSLFYLLTGRVVYGGETMMKKLLAHREAAIPSLMDALQSSPVAPRQDSRTSFDVGSLNDGQTGNARSAFVSRSDTATLAALDSVFCRMVAKRPGERYQSMAEVIADLERCRSGEAVTVNVAAVGGESGSSYELQNFLRQISGEDGTQLTSATTGPFGTNGLPESGTTETMLLTSNSAGTDPQTEMTLAGGQRNARASDWSAKTTRSRVVLVTVVGIVGLLLGGWWLLSPPRGVLQIEITDAEIEVELGETGRSLRGEKTETVKLPLGEHVLHVKLGETTLDTPEISIAKGESVEIKVEKVGNRVRVMRGKEFLVAKALTKGKGNGPDVSAVPPPLAVAPFNAAQAKKHQEAWGKYLSQPVEKEFTLPGGAKLSMILIPPGEFVREERGQQFRVRLTKPFYLGKYEVTQAQWQSVMGRNPSEFKDRPTHPVEQVSWDDIQPFLAKMNASSPSKKMMFALPTEAQWEYACRAGTTTAYSFGDNVADLPQYAWFKDNASDKSHPVGQLKPNPFGLHDVHGNAWEWCADWLADDYYAKAPVDDPTGSMPISHRVYRGGGWRGGPGHCRSAYRGSDAPAFRNELLGFRLAAAIDLPKNDSPAAVTTPQLAGMPTTGFALAFAGSEDQVEINGLSVPDAGAFTWEGWVTPKNLSDMSLMSLPTADGQGLFRVAFWSGGPDVVRIANRTQAIGRTSSRSLPKTGSFHLAATLAGDVWTLWVNGKNVGQGTSRFGWNNPIRQSFAAKMGVDWGVPIDSNQRREPFQGTLDEVRISKSARYTAEFTPATRLESDKDTLALYHFDEGNGNVLKDSSGNGRHGKIVGAKWVKIGEKSQDTSPATASFVLEFDGQSSHVKLPNVGLTLQKPLTVEGWVRLAKTAAPDRDQILLMGSGLSLSKSRDGRWFYSAPQQPPQPPQSTINPSDSPAAMGEWVHLAAVSNSESRVLFVNGKRQQQIHKNLPPATASTELLLGAFLRSGNVVQNSLEGQLREVRLSSTVRYSADFQPAQRFSPDQETLALYHCDEGSGDVLNDSSGNNHHGKIVGAKWVKAAVSPAVGSGNAGAKPKPVIDRNDPAFQQWLKSVAPLKPDEQVKAVTAKLKELNPLFTYTPTSAIEGNAVVRLTFFSSAVSDISPVLALPNLTILHVEGHSGSRTFADLSPLRGLNLTNLHVGRSAVSDLSPLREMPLTDLFVHDTDVFDLRPLVGMKLTRLYISNTKVSDLSPLKDMPLVELHCDFKSPRDVEVVRGIKSLKKINGKLADVFWKEEAERAAAFEQWLKQTTTLAPEAQVKAVVEKLKELNPGFDGQETHSIQNGALYSLQFSTNEVTNLAPVRALKGLTQLTIAGIGPAPPKGKPRGILSDLSPLQGLPLSSLRIDNTRASDLSPLQGMPLTQIELTHTLVTDLTPLRGMQLTNLGISGTPVSDLTPVAGMPLKTLGCYGSDVSDLSPLKGMPLTYLHCANTTVSDLSPLRGSPIEKLDCGHTLVADLTPLHDCKNLTWLRVTSTRVTVAGVAALQKALPNCKIEWDQPKPPAAKAPFDAKQARAHQDAWAKHLGTSVETTNSVGAKMILIPPGEFLMGSTDAQIEAAVKEAEQLRHGPAAIESIRKDERPQHRVVITKPFLMGATEVTIGQFKKFVAATGHQTQAERTPADPLKQTYLQPGYPVTDESPVANVSWSDAVRYCAWLSEFEKATYRLPTEAEWEYACRAGTISLYSFGDDPALLEKYAWSVKNSKGQPHPVGTKLSNPFGLFDMHGNVAEWCQDRYDESWYAKSPLEDPVGQPNGLKIVTRGGNWDHHSLLRSAYRTGGTRAPIKGIVHYTLGFRVVRVLAAPTK